jgi:carboxymethylenebutenolidase
VRHILLIAALLVAAAAASAPTADGQRLERSPRHQEYVTVKHGDRAVKAFIVFPEVKNKAPAVLVIHEIFGLSDWIRGVADQLAGAGYIAIAPDLLSGMAPGGGGTAEMGGQDAITRAVSGLPPEQVTADLNAVADYVTRLPACNGHLAVAGFCWGGGQSFRFATDRPSLKAAFVFYGPPPQSERDLARIRCPVYGFYGGNDARITATVAPTAELMRKAGKSYEPVTYEGAGHGFMRASEAPGATGANKKAHDEAWARWKSLLRRI